MEVFRIKLFLGLLVILLLPVRHAMAQCASLPSVTALGSNKFPVGLCAPVHANVTYNVTFTAPVPAGTLELVYNWGDGSPLEVVPLATGQKSFNASRVHDFPAESDCEYFVTMTVRYNGQLCTATRQIQKIASWRTDAYNGGHLKLHSPVTETPVHEVCEGEDIDVVFQDKTDWSCHADYIEEGPNAIESPNLEYRWQQIIYNTSSSPGKIANIKVDGVQITGENGADIKTSYQDPRGIHYMSAPVVRGDERLRPSLRITAPGGFGAGYPKAGEVFEITLRYWNFCNPYDDPNIPGPPADKINGDHPPVSAIAKIRVKEAPKAPAASELSFCNGTTPQPFSVTGVTTGSTINWYENLTNPDRPGKLISSGTATSLPVTEWASNKKPGIYKVWASQKPNVPGAVNCESPATLVTRIVREELSVAAPLTPAPTDICNNSTFTVTMPAAATEAIGGSTKYIWTGSGGIGLVSSTANSATFKVNVTDFGTALSINRGITITRQYTGNPACAKSASYLVRIHRPAVGGNLSAVADVCETSMVGTISLSGHTGTVKRWEVKKNAGSFVTYNGEATGTSITPGILEPGVYTFRAVIGNGICQEAFSSEEQVEVFQDAASKAFAGNDQFLCDSLSSGPLGASSPLPGNGVWSFVSSVPAGLPAPVFSTSKNDPNTFITINEAHGGAYTLRWTVSNGSCSSYDDVVIDFGTNPSDPKAGNDKAVCGPITSLEGNVPVKGLGTWTVVSGPKGCSGAACPVSITTPSSPSSEVTLNGAAYGEYVFRWTISSGGNDCFSKQDDVKITFDRPAQVNASDINDICLDPINLTPIALSGTVEGGASSGKWMNVSGKGTISTSTVKAGQPLTVEATYTPSFEDYQAGTAVVVKIVSTPEVASSCPAVEKTITINFDRKPVANAGKDIPAICSDTVKLAAEQPVHGASGMWTTTQAGVVFDNPADPNTIVRNLPLTPANTTVTWTLTSAGGKCVSEPSSIKLTRVAPPAAFNIAPVACEIAPSGAPVTTQITLTDYEQSVTSLPAANRVITWYKDATPVINPAAVQKDVASGQKYVAHIRDINTNCTSDATLTINVRPLPVVKDATVKLCEDVAGSNTASVVDLTETQYKAAVTGEQKVTVSWFTNEGDAMNNLSPITEPIKVTGGKDVYARVTYNDTEPHCFDVAKLTLAITPLPTVSTIFGREAVCQGDATQLDKLAIEIYQVTPIAGAKYFWNIPSDAKSQFKVFGGGKETDFYVMLQFPNVYTGKISVRVEMNGCSSPVIEKEIMVSASPIKPVIKGVGTVCEDGSSVSFTVSPNNYPSSTYYWEIRRASDNSLGGAYIVDGQSTGTILANFLKEDVIVSVRESNSICVSPMATKMVSINKRPAVTAVIDNEISCFQGTDGSVRAQVQGGTAPYTTYTLDQTGVSNGNGIFSNLSPGNYSIKVKDSNGCTGASNTVTLGTKVVEVMPDFTIDNSQAQCSGGEFTFRWKAEEGISYRWEWADGSTEEFTHGKVAVGERMITHRFNAASSQVASVYPVKLFASSKTCPEKFVSKTVTIYPGIVLNISTRDTVVCSDETVSFLDQSAGVDNGKWYYRELGTNQRLGEQAGARRDVSFKFENTTTRNPIVYEVVYEASNNEGCTAQYRQEIIVYRGITATFEVSKVPVFTGGVAQIAVVNTSTPNDENDFEYAWSFGEHASVARNDAQGIRVDYFSAGVKDITLTTINVDAREAGEVCQSVARQQIEIPVPKLRAEFKASPLAACFPANIEVENLSPGADTFLWRLYNENELITTSNLRNPVFRIVNPGTYSLKLTASYEATGQADSTELKGIEVLDVPHAAFTTRSTPVFAPDTQVEPFNYSERANVYHWDFGDGYTSLDSEPRHAYDLAGTYKLTLLAGYDYGMKDTDGDGIADSNVVCYDSTSKEIVAVDGSIVQAPNAFTPNLYGPTGGALSSGGFNDVFLPIVKGVLNFKMQVYDRWGTLVFESNDPNIGWDGYNRDGKLMPASVYVYKLFLDLPDGERTTRVGDVTLIR